MEEIRSVTPEHLLNGLISTAQELNKKHHRISILYLRNDFRIVFNELLALSTKENFCWDLCPFPVYQSTFEARKKDFLSAYNLATEKQFIESEIEYLNRSLRNGGLYFSPKITYEWESDGFPEEIGHNVVRNVDLELKFLKLDTIDNIIFSQRRKLDFLNELLKNLPKELVCNEKNIEIDQTDLKNINKVGIIEILKDKFPELNRSSNKLNFILKEIITSSPPNYKYRIGLLIHLGILDAIKEKIKRKESTVNPNRIALWFNPIFGNKQTSIEPIFRAFETNVTDSDKYPYTDKVKSKIQQKLSEIDLQIPTKSMN